jgi:hypothetical protein
MDTSTDRIERKILLKASRARVWRALSCSHGAGIRRPSIRLSTIRKSRPRWWYSKSQEVAGRYVLLTLSNPVWTIPLSRRATVMRLNTSGWDEQMKNIEKHVAAP